MVRKLALLALSALIVGSGVATAESLSPQARLRKLSLQLRGIAPAKSEFDQLQSVDPSGRDEFFALKSRIYLASDIGVDKLSDRLFEVLRFELPEKNLLLRESVHRTHAQVGLDLAAGFELSMNGLKSVVNREISKGRSWDEILTSDQVMYLPIAGQALTEFAQANAELRAGLEKLKSQGVAIGSPAEIKRALEILSGAVEAPAGVTVETLTTDIPADNLVKAAAAARRVAPLIRKIVAMALPDNVDEYDNALKARQSSLGEEKGLVAFHQSEASSYFDYGSSLPAVKDEISAGEAMQIKCLLNAVNMNQNVQARYKGLKCSPYGFASPLLVPEVSAWLLDLDLSKPDQATAAVDYLVARAKSPEMMEEILGGSAKEELFSVPSVVSTQEFRDRYRKTRYSRAAAFFRTYFCDDMQPVITIDNSKKTAEALKGLTIVSFDTPADARAHAEVMAMITPDTRPEAMKPESTMTVTQPEAVSTSNGNAHFRPECVACHRKLDPARELIAGEAEFSGGKMQVVYDDADGTEVRVPIKDASELPGIIVKQEQYVRCQSERMWAWTIGEDVTIDSSRRAQLTSLYRQMEAKPLAIMAALVQRPEYVSDDAFTQAPTFSTVAPLLNRCNSCHAKEEDIPSFTTIPIDGEDHSRWLAKIAKSVNLGNGGKNAKMPKENAGWSLTEADRMALGRWIWTGARDDSGRPTIDEDDREKILKNVSPAFLKSISSERTAVASFRPTWRRYMENYDLLNVLAQKFPTTYEKCAASVDAKSRGALGFKDKASGAPSALVPGVAAVEWLNRCLYAVASNEMSVVAARGPWRGLEMTKEWTSVDETTKRVIYAEVVNELIGPGVLNSEDQADLEMTIRETLNDLLAEKPTLTVTQAVADAMFTVMNDERFLTY